MKHLSRTPSLSRRFTIILFGALSSLLPSFVRAEVKGDGSLMQTAAIEIKANLDRIETWRGVAKMTITFGETGEIEKITVPFFLDRGNKFLRWTWTPDNALAPVPPGTIPKGRYPRIVHGLVREGRAYRLQGHSYIDKDKGTSHASLVTQPLKDVAGLEWTGSYFDPVWYMEQSYGIKIHEQLAFLFREAAHPKIECVVTRTDNVVRVQGKINRFDVDLDSGNNLVFVELAEPGRATTYTLTWQKVSGIWIPRRYLSSRPADYKGRVVYNTRQIDWQENVLNEPIAAEIFSVESLPLVPGDRVSDVQTGVSYEFEKIEVKKQGVMGNGMSWVLSGIGTLVAFAWLSWRRLRHKHVAHGT